MSTNKETSKAIDIILKLLALGTITGVTLAAPNALKALDKPLHKLFYDLNNREKARKLSKLRNYMMTQGLVRGEYDHGLELTNKALARLKKHDFDNLEIPIPTSWDCKWRLVIFDIPETKRDYRVSFTRKLQKLGFQLLQQSVWLHPYPCKNEVIIIADKNNVRRWVTYIETDHIDNSQNLVKRFSKTFDR